MADGEADLFGGGYQSVGVVDLAGDAGDEVVDSEQHETDPGRQHALVDEDAAVVSCGPKGDASRARNEVDGAGDAPAVVVGEHVLADVAGDVELGRQLVGVLLVVLLGGHGRDAITAARHRATSSTSPTAPRA